MSKDLKGNGDTTTTMTDEIIKEHDLENDFRQYLQS